MRSVETALAETYGVTADADNLAVIEGADIIVLAMKPQHLATAMDGIKSGLRGDQAVLSIVAGAPLETLTKGAASPSGHSGDAEYPFPDSRRHDCMDGHGSGHG